MKISLIHPTSSFSDPVNIRNNVTQELAKSSEEETSGNYTSVLILKMWIYSIVTCITILLMVLPILIRNYVYQIFVDTVNVDHSAGYATTNTSQYTMDVQIYMSDPKGLSKDFNGNGN